MLSTDFTYSINMAIWLCDLTDKYNSNMRFITEEFLHKRAEFTNDNLKTTKLIHDFVMKFSQMQIELCWQINYYWDTITELKQEFPHMASLNKVLLVNSEQLSLSIKKITLLIKQYYLLVKYNYDDKGLIEMKKQLGEMWKYLN